MLEEVQNFVTVLVVAVAIAGGISSLYAIGLRLWTAAKEGGGAAAVARVGSVVCFGACVVIVLFALWLMIPAFHR